VSPEQKAAQEKEAAGLAAAALVKDGMTVGLGTGSTAAHFIRALGQRAWTEGLSLRCVATSWASDKLAAEVGLQLVDLNDAGEIDLTVDGADEIGPGLALIKGGGAALLREKLVWEASRRCIVIADSAKRVPRLGQFPLPVEVVAFGHRSTAHRLFDALSECDLGAAPRLRVRDGTPVVTDSGGYIYDIPCGAIADPTALADALKAVTGVVDHGLFIDLADEALVAVGDRVETVTP
jgi:ribose 5-phosphate isomerase A